MPSLQKKLRDETVDSSIFGIEESQARLMTGFDNPTGERLFALSDITPNEVFGLNLIKSYADKFSSPLVDDWIKRHLLFRISRLRIGRKELVLLLSGIAQSEKSGKKKSLSDLFSGLK